eukprot:TRINITY_DN7541_c0_g1_i1.p1 TRINITY_DN7541_c0_g1~~TRINITY_DN7541_c0_g1_i1.p1  ORF type:complete len:85 (+),score=6.38 TRINITY_DN7541_c0_g1_i1:305-559(+)
MKHIIWHMDKSLSDSDYLQRNESAVVSHQDSKTVDLYLTWANYFSNLAPAVSLKDGLQFLARIPKLPAEELLDMNFLRLADGDI